jgi:hypothetical protein
MGDLPVNPGDGDDLPAAFKSLSTLKIIKRGKFPSFLETRHPLSSQIYLVSGQN